MAGNPNWQPGTSGNPAGRPKKERAWTTLLEKAGAKTTDYQGKRVAKRGLLAEFAMEAVTTGKVTFDDGTVIKAETFKDWTDFAKWIYSHIDGPPKSEIDLSGNVGLSVTYINDWRDPTN